MRRYWRRLRMTSPLARDRIAAALFFVIGQIEVLTVFKSDAPLVGSPWVEFWDGQDRGHAQAAIEEARQGKVGRFTGFFPTTQTKTPAWWSVSITAILDKVVEQRPRERVRPLRVRPAAGEERRLRVPAARAEVT